MASAAAPSLVRLHGLERSDRVQTYAQIAETVQRVQAGIEARGLKCRPSSALGSLFQKAQVLNEQWEAQTNGEDILTLMQADEAVRIAQAVEAVLDLPEAEEAVHCAGDPMQVATKRSNTEGTVEDDFRCAEVGRQLSNPTELSESPFQERRCFTDQLGKPVREPC